MAVFVDPSSDALTGPASQPTGPRDTVSRKRKRVKSRFERGILEAGIQNWGGLQWFALC